MFRPMSSGGGGEGSVMTGKGEGKGGGAEEDGMGREGMQWCGEVEWEWSDYDGERCG